MHVFIALLAGLLIGAVGGAGLAWSFRGYIERKKNAAAAALRSSVEAAAKKI